MTKDRACNIHGYQILNDREKKSIMLEVAVLLQLTYLKHLIAWFIHLSIEKTRPIVWLMIVWKWFAVSKKLEKSWLNLQLLLRVNSRRPVAGYPTIFTINKKSSIIWMAKLCIIESNTNVALYKIQRDVSVMRKWLRNN